MPFSSSNMRRPQILSAIFFACSSVSDVCTPKRADLSQLDYTYDLLSSLSDTDTAFSVSPEYEKNLLIKRDIYRKETKTDKALKIVVISAENISGKANTEHITRVLTLDDLFMQ